jgi:hypothetical protein
MATLFSYLERLIHMKAVKRGSVLILNEETKKMAPLFSYLERLIHMKAAKRGGVHILN